jgi:hypothetical protein
VHIDELFYAFPYDDCALLIAQQATLLRAVRDALPGDRAAGVAGCLAGWDGVLLLLDEALDPALAGLFDSQFAMRMGFVMVSELQEPRFAWQLRRLASAAWFLPPARVLMPREISLQLAALPIAWQAVVHRALRSPHEWSVKRICHECGVDRRTLERGFRRVALPAPKVVLAYGGRSVVLRD